VELRLLEERYNPLLLRREVIFEADHTGAATPSRPEIAKRISALMNSRPESTVVVKLKTSTGLNLTKGVCHIYDSPQRTLQIEPEYVRLRNLPKEQREATQKAKEKTSKKTGVKKQRS
jgi:ribosomal protein S24E